MEARQSSGPGSTGDPERPEAGRAGWLGLGECDQGDLLPERSAPREMLAYLPLPTRPVALGEVLRLWTEPNRDLSRLKNPYLACLGHRLGTGHSVICCWHAFFNLCVSGCT